MKQTIKRFFAIMAALLMFATSYAQVTTSSMSGVVKGQDGEPLTGAAVIATHTPSGTQYYAIANTDGRYTIQGMRPGGPYEVQISFVGCQTNVYKDITLSLGETYAQSATLKNSETLNEVFVIAEAKSRLNQEKTGVATNISSQQMKELPSVSRSVTDLVKISPYGGDGLNFSGSSGRSANFTVDGANVNNNFGLSTALPGGGNPISVDALEEIQVVVSPYDVRQTNFIGGGVNAITKSGTNTFKGSVYTYYYNENMHGNRVDGVELERSKDRQTTYGFTLGGPIVKNKLFFFINAEKIDFPAEANNWRPSADGVADPDRMLSRVSVADAQLVKNYLLNTYNYDPGNYDSYPAAQNNIKLLARIDWNITRNHKLALRYNSTNSNTWKLPSTSRDVSDMGLAMASQYGLVFSNSMYNQMNNLSTISADLNSRLTDEISNQFLVTYSNIQDVRGFNGDFFPFVEILAGDIGCDGEPYMDFGTELFTYRNNVQNTVLNIKDDITIYKGNHRIMAGASYEAQMALNTYMRNGTGMYRFASLSDFTSGKAPVEMAFDWGFDGDEYPSAKVRFGQAGIYGQDEWSVTDNFKLTMGLRFDSIFFNNDDVMTNNAALAIDYGGRNVDTGLWPKTNIQISPRLGFSWDVFGDKSLKVRGGSGLYAGRIPLVFFTNMPTNAGIVKGRLIKMKDPEVLSKMVENGKLITDRWAILDALNSYNATTYPKTITPETAPAPSEIAGVDRNFKMPQVWKSSISVDYSLPVSFPLSVTGEFIYNKTLNGVMLTNYNITDDNAGWATFNGPDQRHVYPSSYKYDKVDAYVLTNTNKGYGWMGSFMVKAQPADGLDIVASYTHTVSQEVTGMPGSNASAAWKYIPSVDGPNFNILHNSSYNSLPDRVMASVSYQDKSNNHFSLMYEGLRYSGNSYIYSNDLNGDGNAYDLMYIPKDESEIRFISNDDAVRYWEFANQDKYLSSHKGQYAEAYAICQPMRHVFDFRYAHDFVIKVGNTRNTIQLSADFQNVGNLFNSCWGVTKGFNPDVPNASGNAKVLKYERTDSDGVPVFSTAVDSGVSTWDYTHSLANCWYMQVGIRYMFN